MIARELSRSPGTVCCRCRSGRKPRLALDGPLFAEIARLLRLGWSPEQIASRRKRIENGMEQPSGLRVSHEAIYTALYAQQRGELGRELLSDLRQAKSMRGRKPKGSERRGKLVGMTNIRGRPEEVEGPLVSGHWEGDLLLGTGRASAVGTLVKRTTPLVVLVIMATRRARAFSDQSGSYPAAAK
jgi:IS30 family transposase